MKTNLIIVSLIGAVAFSAMAETNTFIRGNLNIDFQSRKQDGKPNVADVYDMTLNVNNSVVFNGSIAALPWIKGAMWNTKQNASLTFQMNLAVINPRQPDQSKNIGKLSGFVPITKDGVYHFDQGNVKISTFQLGNSPGINSNFGGDVAGKTLDTNISAFAKLQKGVLNFKKQMGNKIISNNVTNYDIMSFKSHVIPQGPVPFYPSAVINGAMVYDYDSSKWYFQNLTITYNVAINGQSMTFNDVLTGDIVWIPDQDRKNNGLGEYQFDIRVNAPPINESDVFAASQNTSDESAYFQTSVADYSLTGTMKYKDTLDGATDDATTLASKVTIDLVGTKLTKQQVMNLCKVVLFTSVVPMNSD